jgi:hypothetical protein
MGSHLATGLFAIGSYLVQLVLGAIFAAAGVSKLLVGRKDMAAIVESYEIVPAGSQRPPGFAHVGLNKRRGVLSSDMAQRISGQGTASHVDSSDQHQRPEHGR